MREYEGPGGASLSQDTKWNIGDYVDSAILARAKLLLLGFRMNGVNYLSAVYLTPGSTQSISSTFELERHNNMTSVSSTAFTDHVYHVFFTHALPAHTVTATACFEYNVTISTTAGYHIDSINQSAWGNLVFGFYRIYVFYQ